MDSGSASLSFGDEPNRTALLYGILCHVIHHCLSVYDFIEIREGETF